MYQRGEFLNDDSIISEILRSEHKAGFLQAQPSNWPASLKAVLSLILAIPTPVCVFWGSEYTVFCNDAFLKVNSAVKEDIGMSLRNGGLAESLPGLNLHEILEKVSVEGERWDYNGFQYIFKSPQEESFYCIDSFNPVFDDREKPCAVTMVLTETCQEAAIQNSLKEKENELDFAIGAADLGTWVYYPETQKVKVNDRVAKWFGVSPASIDLATFLNNILEKDRGRVSKEIEYALTPESGGLYDVQYEIQNAATGVKRTVVAKGKTQFDELKNAIRFQGTLQDITPAILALQRIDVAEERLRLAHEASDLGTFELSLSTRQITYSPRLSEIFGHRHSRQMAHPEFVAQVHPEDAKIVQTTFQQCLDTGKYFYEARIIKPDRDIAWIRTRGKLILDAEGQPSKILGTVSDITEEKNYQENIRKSEHKARMLVENAPFPIGVYAGSEMVVEMANQSIIDVWGKGPDVIGKKFIDVLPELKDENFMSQLQDVFDSGKSIHEKHRRIFLNVHGQLKEFFFDYSYTPLFDLSGKVFGVMNTAADVTELMNAKHRVEESEARFKLLADSLPQLIWAADRYGNLDYWNRATYDYVGLAQEKMEEGAWVAIIHPGERKESFRQWLQSINSGRDFIFEHRFRRSDGEYRWQLSRALPLRDEEGNIQRWVGTSTDIQQIKEQEQLKDFFISMASHELKTPITSLKAHVQILMSKYRDSGDPFLLKSLQAADKQMVKLTKLISELLDLSKIKTGSLTLNMQEFLVNELIAESVDEILQGNAGFKIHFLHDADVVIYADRERIGQVMINLLSNAIKYSSDKQDIYIRTRVHEQTLTVSVEDKGIGISRNELEKIFTRFYRAGGRDEKTFPGFGIGLYIAADIIRRHRGTIGVDSEPMEGSVFFFTLPVNSRHNL